MNHNQAVACNVLAIGLIKSKGYGPDCTISLAPAINSQVLAHNSKACMTRHEPTKVRPNKMPLFQPPRPSMPVVNVQLIRFDSGSAIRSASPYKATEITRKTTGLLERCSSHKATERR